MEESKIETTIETTIETKIKISIGDIPYWLKDSELFSNLIDNNENNLTEEFSLPSRFYRSNSIVSNFEEFREVIKISSFWMIKNPPTGLIEFIELLDGLQLDYKDLKNNEDTISLFPEWWIIFDIIHYYGNDKNVLIYKFIELNNTRMIEYYMNEENPITFHHCIFSAGVKKEIFVYCFKNVQGNWLYEGDEDYFFIECLMNALFENKLECVEYILSLKPSLKNMNRFLKQDEYEEFEICLESFCAKASESGSLECLIYLHENGFPWDESTTLCAGSKGHLDCLKYAISNGCPFNDELIFCSTNKCYEYLQEIMDSE